MVEESNSSIYAQHKQRGRSYKELFLS
jgi:hypothetical protein